ncbi:MAG TPA: S8 family serine peptidase, partial [Bacteroidota bacterium]
MENSNPIVAHRIQLSVLTVSFLLFVTGLNAQPPRYSYLYHDAVVSLTPTGNRFVAKFADERDLSEALTRLEGSGMRVTTNLPTLTGEMAFVIESSTNDPQRLQTLKGIKEVLFAAPVFQGINGKETAALNTFIVKFKSGVSESDIARLNALHDVSVEREDKYSPGGKRMLLSHAWGSSEDAFALSYIYSLSAIVKYATPDLVVFNAFDAEDPAPDDPYYQYQWNLMKVNAEQAWLISKGISSITIAVVDDGVDLQHDDLDGKLVSGYDGYEDDADPSPGGTGPDDSHGTACAGVIGAKTDNNLGIAGLAQNCKVMPIRAGIGFTLYYWAAIAGINWAVAHGADIISNSWGGGDPYQDLEEAIDYAVTDGRGGKGCVVLFSSGNISGSVLYPGSLSNVIAVGATDADDEIWDYSCTGSALDVVAPSGDTDFDGDIWTTDLSGSAGVSSTDYMSVFGGTSAACPLVAGLAGLILSKDSYLTNIQVQTILQHTAKDLGSSGRDDNYGWGRVDAWAALRKTYSGVLPGNEVWRGTVAVSGNVTVPSGVTLLVLPGTTISFAGNYKLRVEGKLLAVGYGAEQPSNPVTFTRSGGQWYGIEFYNGNN